MPLQRNLNKLVQNVAETLSARYAKFRHNKIVPETGEFEASVPAPRNSRAGHLVVSIHKGNIWIRLAIPHAFYLVDDTSEMVRIIDAFLSDEVFFAIVTFRRKWVETTLVRRNTALDIDSKVGTVQVISWSGKHDKKFRLRLSQKRRPTRG